MEDAWFIPLWLQLIVAAGFFAAFGAGAWLLSRHLIRTFRNGGGWGKLAAAYGTDRTLPDEHLRGQTIQVGSVILKRCVDVGLSGAGLQLQLTGIAAANRTPAVLIPWSDFGRIEPARLFWEPAHCLSVGQPTIAKLCVLAPLFAAMRDRLPAVIRMTASRGDKHGRREPTKP